MNVLNFYMFEKDKYYVFCNVLKFE